MLCPLPTDILLPGSQRSRPGVVDKQGIPTRAHQPLYEEYLESCVGICRWASSVPLSHE